MTLKAQCVICSREISPQYFMCAPHWRQVPLDLQRKVWRTWRAWDTCDHLPKTMRLERLEEYRTARQAAIDAVKPATTTNGAESDNAQ